MFHTNLIRNWPTGSRKEYVLSFYTKHGHGSHLVQVTSIILISFYFPEHESLTHKIWFKIAKLFLRKANFGPRSRNDIDLEYLHIFINSNSWLYVSMFRSKAGIVFFFFKNPMFSHFSFRVV